MNEILPPEIATERENTIRNFLDGYFKSPEFKGLLEGNGSQTHKRFEIDPELREELLAHGIKPEEYMSFVELRNKIADKSADTSISTYIAVNNLSEQVREMQLQNGTMAAINEYVKQVKHVEENLPKELGEITDIRTKQERVRVHDQLRHDLHNDAAAKITEGWYKSPSLEISENLINYLDTQGGNSLVELGRPLVSVRAKARIDRIMGQNLV
jgi:hypothetical protein